MGLTKKKLLNIIKEETEKTIKEYGPFSGHLGKFTKPTPEDSGIIAVRNLRAMLNRIEPAARKDLVQTLLSYGLEMVFLEQAFPLPDGTRLEDLMEPGPMATQPAGGIKPDEIKENQMAGNLENIIGYEMDKVMDKLGDLKIDKMVQQLKTVRSMLDDKTLNNESAAKALEVHGILMRSISRHVLEIADALRNPPGVDPEPTRVPFLDR